MSNFTKIFFVVTLFLIAFSYELNAQIYLSPSTSIEERINNLLSQMTLQEKIGQMTQVDHKAVSDLNDIKTYFIGSILSGGGSDPNNGNTAEDWANLYDSFQTKALQ